MKVKVSKVFAAYINKTAKEQGVKVRAEVVAMSERAYLLNVGDVYDAESNGDYDYVNNRVLAIRLLYPETYYAAARYLTTEELTREFRSRRVTDERGLKAMIRDMVEI